jgi:hypothetical protein
MHCKEILAGLFFQHNFAYRVLNALHIYAFKDRVVASWSAPRDSHARELVASAWPHEVTNSATLCGIFDTYGFTANSNFRNLVLSMTVHHKSVDFGFGLENGFASPFGTGFLIFAAHRTNLFTAENKLSYIYFG